MSLRGIGYDLFMNISSQYIMDGKHLYRQVADRIAGMVESGTFKPGDRIPSIRELSRQAQVSINTVKVAYAHLEDRCLIEARPQSGFYVCPKSPK